MCYAKKPILEGYRLYGSIRVAFLNDKIKRLVVPG